MAVSLQAGDLVAKDPGLAAIPAVRDQQHDRSAVQDPPSPLLMKFLQRLADPGAAGPVGHRASDLRNGRVESACAQLGSDTRETAREEERFDTAVAPAERMRKVQE